MAAEARRQLVLDAFERWNSGDREVTLDIATPDIAVHSALTSSTFRGHNGLRRWMKEIDEQFDEWGLTVDEFKDAGQDRLLALGRIHAHGRASGVALDQPTGWLVAFEDDKLAEMWIYMGHAEALRAAGLEEK